MVLVGVGVGMLRVDSRSRMLRMRRTLVARWPLRAPAFWVTRLERTFEATEEGRAFARWLDELMAVEARRFARFTCCAEAERVDSRSRVLDIGRYEP